MSVVLSNDNNSLLGAKGVLQQNGVFFFTHSEPIGAKERAQHVRPLDNLVRR